MTELITSVFVHASDLPQAINFANKALNVYVQLEGLDGPQVLGQHVKMGAIYLAMRDQAREQHALVAAKEKEIVGSRKTLQQSQAAALVAIADAEERAATKKRHGEEVKELKQQASELNEFLKQLQQEIVQFEVNCARHLVAGKYLARLLGGPRHQELISIYRQLGALYSGSDTESVQVSG